MRRTSFALLAIAASASLVAYVAACTRGKLEYLTDGDASSDALAPDAGSADCSDASAPPENLHCTGLYADFAAKQLAAIAQPYAPAIPLWADGADKSRWIELPPGQAIDATDPNEWTFPIGTKLFKEFRVGGKRVETRLFQKTRADFWVYAAYAWNADDTDAPLSYGGPVPVGADGGTWIIPTPDECDECHRGRSDRILGFEAVNLGLPGATGLTLAALVSKGLLAPAPSSTSLAIGDDGTGFAAPALGWMHVNCGVTCHNANPGVSGYVAGMLLRLDPSLLDGGAVTPSWDPLRTTLGVPCVWKAVKGIPRVVPGDPPAGALVQMIAERGTVQMPPAASRVVDAPDVAAITSWIQRMPPLDAGSDAGVHAGDDAGD